MLLIIIISMLLMVMQLRLLTCSEGASIDWEALNKAALEIAKVQQAIGAKRQAEEHTKVSAACNYTTYGLFSTTFPCIVGNKV